MSNGANEQGFVLPYVLAIIAVLAFVTAIAAERLQRSTVVLLDLQDQTRIERMLVTAEAETIYALLTGITLDGGIDLNPNSLVETDYGVIDEDGRIKTSTLSTGSDVETVRDVWSAQGGIRSSSQADGNVYIQLRDVFGLVSLTFANQDNLVSVLTALNVSRSESQSLTAKLSDYTDVDNKRQFKGAERADYRLKNRPIPSNSPLINYDELARVMAWDDALKSIDVIQLKNMTTLQYAVGVKKKYVSAELQDIIRIVDNEPVSAGVSFDVSDLELQDPTMSDVSRLTFWAPTQDGFYKKRVVEIKRDTVNTVKPFQKFWIYETTVSASDLKLDTRSINETKDVIQAATFHIP